MLLLKGFFRRLWHLLVCFDGLRIVMSLLGLALAALGRDEITAGTATLVALLLVSGSQFTLFAMWSTWRATRSFGSFGRRPTPRRPTPSPQEKGEGRSSRPSPLLSSGRVPTSCWRRWRRR